MISEAPSPETKPVHDGPQLFGHPTGLFTLFFAEMWERFSYYGMRALLVFYMTKGFLGYNDSKAYAVYGAYTSMVYLTPYFGGLLADRVLGARRAVVLGGLLMAAGHLMMTIETKLAFFAALALLIVGNGFFKPNISTIVGTLYAPKSERRDAGFTIFYMGINLGAAMSPIVCGYVGETYGWHYGFGLATFGMLVGLAVFVAPTWLTQVLILGGAIGAAVVLPFLQDSAIQLFVRLILAAALVTAAVIAFRALGKGGLPDAAGQPRDPEVARKAALWVYGGCLAAVVVFALLFFQVAVAGYILGITGLGVLGYVIYEMVTNCTRVESNRLLVILILAFFHMLFWAFFEQAGSSLNTFADRNVDRAFETRIVEASEVGQTIELRIAPGSTEARVAALPLLSQEQLGHVNADPAMKTAIGTALRVLEKDKAEKKGEAFEAAQVEDLIKRVQAEPRFTVTGLSTLRAAMGNPDVDIPKTVKWKVAPESVGMGVVDASIPASEFQAANPTFILTFGLIFTALWTWLGARGRDPSAPIKFVLGLAQLGLGFGAIWYGVQTADERGMVFLGWLLLGYLLHTTGELCLSPVGLSLVTKLSPSRIVSTMMGAWFVSIAGANFLAGLIAGLTGGGGHGGEKGLAMVPPPQESLAAYGDVFGQIAAAALIAALVLLALSPLLRKWMHLDEPAT